jgi:ankyrin repeat protein
LLDDANNTVDVNDECYDCTPLFYAAAQGHENMVRYLLQNGAHPDCSRSAAAFHAACKDPLTDAARINIFKMLLAHGGNVNIKNFMGDTPLHFLICAYDSMVEPMRLLLEAGADVSLQNDIGETVFHTGAGLYLQHQEEVFRLLLQHGGGAVNVKDDEGQTALRLLIYKIRPVLVLIFLENGADISIEFDGETAIQVAMKRFGTVPRAGGHDKATDKKNLVEISEILIQHGADPNSKWKDDGRTLLQRAAHDGHYEAVKVLLNNGALAKLEDPAGKLPFELACEGEHLDCIFLLFQRGLGDNLITFRKGGGSTGKRPASAMYE